MPVLIKQHDIVLLTNNVFVGDNYELLRHSQACAFQAFQLARLWQKWKRVWAKL